MTDKSPKQLAYILNYNLPVRCIIPLSDKLKLRFIIKTPTSDKEFLVEHDVVENNIQFLIDDFFNSVIKENLSFVILDMDDQIDYQPSDKITTVSIKVLLIGMNSLKFLTTLPQIKI